MTHGISLNTTFVASSGALLQANAPIGIVGTSASGTINQILRVRNGSDISQFGDRNTGTIVKTLEILQRYGCNNIFVVRVATGADATATATNIIGTNPASGVKTGVHLLRDVWATFRHKPRLILIPGFNTDTIISTTLDVANDTNVDGTAFFNFTVGTSANTAITTRGTATGLGTKNARLVACIPYVRNTTNELEELSIHTVGLIAQTTFLKGFGYTPSNKPLLNVASIESGFNLSYTDQNADNNRLENAGCFTVNMSASGFVGWGNRNALYFQNTNTSLETYIVLQRIKQFLNHRFEDVQSFYIDEPCNYGTGKILETALKNVISSNAAAGNLHNSSTATFNTERTNYSTRTLAYDILIVTDLPTEIVQANLQYSVKL
jgi:phage tail sheath protein FI